MPPAATCRSRRTPSTSAWTSVRRSTGPKSAGPAAGRSGSTTLPSTPSTAAPSLRQATREHEATGRRARGLRTCSRTPPPNPLPSQERGEPKGFHPLPKAEREPGGGVVERVLKRSCRRSFGTFMDVKSKWRRRGLVGSALVVVAVAVFTSPWVRPRRGPVPAALARLPGAVVPGVYAPGKTYPAAVYAVDTSDGLVLVDSGEEA